MHISALSEPTLVKIFEYLSAYQRIRIETVSVQWNGLSKRAWTKFRTLDDSSLIHGSQTVCNGPTLGIVLKKASTLRFLLSRCGKYLKTLKFNTRWPDAYIYDVLSITAEFCPNLQSVAFFQFPFMVSSLRPFAVKCCKLKSVTFTQCLNRNFDFRKRDVFEFFRNCPNLTSLNLNCNEKLTGYALDCSEITGYALDCPLPRHLEYLSLSGCLSFQNAPLECVANRCLDLRYLNLNGCLSISTECLETVFQHLTKLQVVNLADYGVGKELSKALSNLSELQKLYLHNNQRINDDTLVTLSRSCPNLSVLDVSSCRITDVGLHGLRWLENLVELNFLRCNITNVGVKILAKLQKLEILCLKSCNEITDEAISDLAIFCCNLINLDLSFCTQITVATVGMFYSIAPTKTVCLSLILTGTRISMEEIQVTDPMLKLIL